MATKGKKVTPPKISNTPLSDAQSNSIASAIIAGLNADNSSSNATVGTSTSTKVTRLNYESAKNLLAKAMDDANYMGTLSPADIKNFMKLFETAQNAQIEKVVTTSSNKTIPGATADAASNVVNSTKTQQFPSAFDPTEFAKDFIWQKIDFKNEKNLGAKALTALGQVRGIAKAFNLFGVSDNNIRDAAKQVAMGSKTLDAYTIELQQLAKKEYPEFADRFSIDPTLTTYDIASPIINMLAKTWEVDPTTIGFDNPIVASYMHYAGSDGKGKQPSYYDLLLKAKADPKYQYTQEANTNARDAASGLARAFGFGV